ncbi:MAG: DUF4249 family protein [Bacteroidales bacterium]
MRKGLLYAVLVTAGFCGCVEDAPLIVETTNKVVVNCILQDSDNQTLTLVYSKSRGGGLYYEPVQEAAIKLFENDTLVGEFVKAGSRTWEINFRPEFGANYRLEIVMPDWKDIQANTTMPPVPKVELVYEEHYIKRFSQIDQQYSQWLFVLNSTFDERWENFFETPQINSSDRLLSNIATNHPSADRFNQYGNLGDVIGTAASLPAYDFYIRLAPIIDSTIFDVEANYCPTCFVVFRNSSPEYDQYFKTSFQKMLIYVDENDPGAWFDESVVYSNIENGVGIFGAYTDKVFVFGNAEIP